MKLVINSGPEWIGEEGDGLVEDTLLLEFGGGFDWVELEAWQGMN